VVCTFVDAFVVQSYGGGVAAHLMGDPSATFTCGVSVAPVASKAYYGQRNMPISRTGRRYFLIGTLFSSPELIVYIG